MLGAKWLLAAAAIAPAFSLAQSGAAEPVGEPDARIQLILDDPAEALAVADRREAHREKGPYLGISASPPPRVLRKQLGLPPGMGLVIDFVVPDSPASKAGVLQYDVLRKLDDQIIVNPQQLAVLVRAHKPGDEVKLEIIRDGKPQTIGVALVEHELEPLPDEEEIEGGMPLRRFMPEPRVAPMPPGQYSPRREWNKGAEASSLTCIENGRSYTVVTDSEGHKTFTSKDKDGKTVFTGPIDTPQEREKLPADLKAKLEWMEQHMHVSASVGGGPTTQPAK